MSNTKYSDPSCLEEIELDANPEPVKRYFYKVEFPAITYRGNTLMYVNEKAADLFSCEYVSISTTPEYVILRPANKYSALAFRVTPMKTGKMIRVPHDMKEKKIARGIHRLYKYKDGYCFKRNEVIEGWGDA